MDDPNDFEWYIPKAKNRASNGGKLAMGEK
jgi:hypothetical protein